MSRDKPPQSAADEREEPYYIDTECPECNEELVLYDSLSDETLSESGKLGGNTADSADEIWYDEWVCPDCLDGIHLDTPNHTQ